MILCNGQEQQHNLEIVRRFLRLDLSSCSSQDIHDFIGSVMEEDSDKDAS